MQFDLIRRMGIHVLEDPELDVEVCFVEDRHLAIVRAGLDHAERSACADWLLSAVAATESRSAT